MEQLPQDFMRWLKNMTEQGYGSITKKVPATPEQVEKFKALEDLRKKSEEAEGRWHATRKIFWAEIELLLNEYKHMHFNDKTNEIEVYGEDSGTSSSGGIISPIQIKID